MTYKDAITNFLSNWKRNKDRSKGPAHVVTPTDNMGNKQFRQPLKKGWRRVGTPKEREGDDKI